MSNIFSGRLPGGVAINHDTLTHVNLTTLEVNAAWWNAAAHRLDIPAGYNLIQVQAAGFWEYWLSGTVRRVTVQSQALLTERADNRVHVLNTIFLTTVGVSGVFHNPTLAPLSLDLGFYHDAGTSLQVFEAALFVRCSIE